MARTVEILEIFKYPLLLFLLNMIGKRGSLLIALFLALVMSSAAVNAQENILDQVFKPLFTGFNIGTFYQNYGNAIDFILLMILFISLSMMAFDRIPAFKESPAGKTVAVAVGIILAFSAAYAMYSQTPPYTLAKLGPVALLILVGLVAVAIFRVTHSLGGTTFGSGAIAFVIAYNSLNAVAPAVFKFISESVPMLAAILALVNLGAIMIGGWSIFKMFGAGFKQITGAGTGPIAGAAGRAVGRAEQAAASLIDRIPPAQQDQEVARLLVQIQNDQQALNNAVAQSQNALMQLIQLRNSINALAQRLQQLGV